MNPPPVPEKAPKQETNQGIGLSIFDTLMGFPMFLADKAIDLGISAAETLDQFVDGVAKGVTNMILPDPIKT